MEQSFRGQFLISMPHMMDPWFSQSLSVICEHSEQGAMALIINKPLDLTLGDIFGELKIAGEHNLNKPVYFGGPVQPEQGFILHSYDGRSFSNTLIFSDELALTSSRDILEAIAKGEGPKQFIVALGYAGWSENQLEEEITRNSWLTTKTDTQVLFETDTEQKLKAAAQSMGIDLSLLTSDSGHA